LGKLIFQVINLRTKQNPGYTWFLGPHARGK